MALFEIKGPPSKKGFTFAQSVFIKIQELACIQKKCFALVTQHEYENSNLK